MMIIRQNRYAVQEKDAAQNQKHISWMVEEFADLQ
jgi:hypothetical protein